MPREVDPDVQAMIDSGHCRQHTAIDITPLAGSPAHFSTAEVEVDGVEYTAQLDKPKALQMGIIESVDMHEFGVQNVVPDMERAIVGATNLMNGARAVSGAIFINEETDDRYYDARLPGELVTGEASNETVEFKLVSDLDAVTIAGRTFASIFPWREPVNASGIIDPNDLIPPTGRGIDGGYTGGRDPDTGRPFHRYVELGQV